MTQKTIHSKARNSLPSHSSRLDLGTWGRFYVWDGPVNFKMPRLGGRGGVRRLTCVCLHCGLSFKTNREEQRFCKDGCRTYNNRLKRAAIIRWMVRGGIPFEIASDAMEVSGLAVMGRKMESMGFIWSGSEWEKQ